MTAKEYSIKTNCSEAELGKMSGTGWTIQFMQFMESGNLHVVFVRDVPVAVAPAPVVTIIPAAPSKPIVNRPLSMNATVIGLDEPARSIPLTHNKPKPGETRKVNVPVGDPVMEEAKRVGRETFDRVRAEGEAKIRQARPYFMQGV